MLTSVRQKCQSSSNHQVTVKLRLHSLGSVSRRSMGADYSGSPSTVGGICIFADFCSSVNNTVADVALGWRVDLFSFIRNLKPICIVIAYLFTGTCVGVCVSTCIWMQVGVRGRRSFRCLGAFVPRFLRHVPSLELQVHHCAGRTGQ